MEQQRQGPIKYLEGGTPVIYQFDCGCKVIFPQEKTLIEHCRLHGNALDLLEMTKTAIDYIAKIQKSLNILSDMLQFAYEKTLPKRES